mgnify:CR=1 FL=1
MLVSSYRIIEQLKEIGMSIKFDDKCPACESWLADDLDNLPIKLYRDRGGFQCPKCKENIRMKPFFLYLTPLAFILWPSSKLGYLFCEKFDAACMPLQNYLQFISSISLIIFVILIFSQSLEIKSEVS